MTRQDQTAAVRWVADDRFSVEIRGHTLFVDQPTADGGDDTAPTPTELFVAALGACVAFYARRFLTRHDIDPTGLTVRTAFVLAEQPHRVGHIDVTLNIPGDLPEQFRERLLAISSRCTVHNSLAQPLRVAIDIA